MYLDFVSFTDQTYRKRLNSVDSKNSTITFDIFFE